MTIILIENGVLLSPDGPRLNERAGWVALDGDRIAAIGSGTAPQEWRTLADRVIDARHMAVLPGLLNGHTHLSQTFLRGLADDRPLLRWLKEVIWPAQGAMTPEDQYLAALLGLVENLRCGAATVVQHHKLPGWEYEDAVCRAAVQVGVRMVLARGWVDLGAAGEPLDRILADMTHLHETWDGANGGRISVASGPLTPWRCCDDAMREVTALARSWGATTHIHVAEAQDEIDLLRERCGRGHIEWLADLDCLGPDTQLVHAVHVTDAELDLIAQSGARSSIARRATCTWHPARRPSARCLTGAFPFRSAQTAPVRTIRRTCSSAQRWPHFSPSIRPATPRRFCPRISSPCSCPLRRRAGVGWKPAGRPISPSST